MRMLHLTPGVTKELYFGKDYYDALIKQMTSDPSIVLEIETPTIQLLREWVFDTRTKWVREGDPQNKNIVHASDSAEAAERELRLFNA